MKKYQKPESQHVEYNCMGNRYIEFKKSPENVELIEGLTMEVKFPIKYTGYKVSG